MLELADVGITSVGVVSDVEPAYQLLSHMQPDSAAEGPNGGDWRMLKRAAKSITGKMGASIRGRQQVEGRSCMMGEQCERHSEIDVHGDIKGGDRGRQRGVGCKMGSVHLQKFADNVFFSIRIFLSTAGGCLISDPPRWVSTLLCPGMHYSGCIRKAMISVMGRWEAVRKRIC